MPIISDELVHAEKTMMPAKYYSNRPDILCLESRLNALLEFGFNCQIILVLSG